MPKILRRFLFRFGIEAHFRLALGLALVSRLLSAWFVYGPQALDDYKHGVWPAYQLATGLTVDLPDYRSYLLVGYLSIFVEVAGWFGFTSALAQVRAMYIGLGLTSLLALWGTYYFARTQRSRLFGPLALYLVAVFPIMPFVSTRAFGEAVAMSLVALAFGLLIYAYKNKPKETTIWISGFLILGLATLFRFHVGLMYVAFALWILVKKQWRGLIAAGVAGLVTLALQATVDLLSGKEPLATLFIYLNENQGGAAKYGVMPWYNPVLFVLGLSLVPFSLPLWRSWRTLWRRQKEVLIPWLLFVIAHCMVAHKEERFLYPILVLELWALACLWAANAHSRWARRIFSPAILIVTILLLPVTTLVNTQEGEIEPPAYIQSRFDQVLYLDDESLFGRSRFQFYFLRPPARLETITADEMTAHKIDDILSQNPDLKAVAILTSKPEVQIPLQALANVRTVEAQCEGLRESGSLVDRLLFQMNPKHNQRRRPTWYLVCRRLSST